MVGLLTATIISCSDAIGLLNRIQKVIGLTRQQKIELVQVIKEHIHSCPIKIEPDGRKSD